MKIVKKLKDWIYHIYQLHHEIPPEQNIQALANGYESERMIMAKKPDGKGGIVLTDKQKIELIRTGKVSGSTPKKKTSTKKK